MPSDFSLMFGMLMVMDGCPVFSSVWWVLYSRSSRLLLVVVKGLAVFWLGSVTLIKWIKVLFWLFCSCCMKVC